MIIDSRKYETPKEVAKAILDELGVYVPFVQEFESSDVVYLFDSLDPDAVKGYDSKKIMPGSEQHKKIQEIEQRSNVKVYAVTHENLAVVGETYSFLCVSPYPEDWEHCFRGARSSGWYMAYAYVQNMEDDLCSEYGYVAITANHGVIKRGG